MGDEPENRHAISQGARAAHGRRLRAPLTGRRPRHEHRPAICHNLAWKLAAVLRGAPERLLESYDAERRGHVMRTYEMSNDFGSEVFEIIEAGLGGDFARVHDLVANSRRAGAGLGVDLGWRYEHGAFVPEPGQDFSAPREPDTYIPTAEPGRRAPHAWLERDGQRLSTLDLLGLGFAVLVAGDATPWRTDATHGGFEVENIFHRHAGWLSRRGGPFRRALFELQPGGAVLVRPDGVVGWRAKTPPTDPRTALTTALARILGA